LLEESGIESRLLWFDLGVTYGDFARHYEKAVKAFEEVEKISLERDDDWKYSEFYFYNGKALHNAGKHEKEKEILEIGRRLFPDRDALIQRQIICALSQDDTIAANEYIKFWKSLRLDLGHSEVSTESALGTIYYDANILDKAEVYLRNALEINPDIFIFVHFSSAPEIYPDILFPAHFSLASFLIDNEINIKYESGTWRDHFIKGFKLYKQGDTLEALEILKKSFDLKPSYSYPLDQLIQEVEQALANQKKEQ
jgi:tetratricopeptide (TPR) repeat protein